MAASYPEEDRFAIITALDTLLHMTDTSDNLRAGMPGPEPHRAITEMEIIAFMQKHKIKPLVDINTISPDLSILAVLPNQVRHDNGPYQTMDAADRPSIARIYKPTHLGNDITGDFIAHEGKVDYYKINRKGEQEYLFTGGKQASYPIPREFLYEKDDILFPPR